MTATLQKALAFTLHEGWQLPVLPMDHGEGLWRLPPDPLTFPMQTCLASNLSLGLAQDCYSWLSQPFAS